MTQQHKDDTTTQQQPHNYDTTTQRQHNNNTTTQRRHNNNVETAAHDPRRDRTISYDTLNTNISDLSMLMGATSPMATQQQQPQIIMDTMHMMPHGTLYLSGFTVTANESLTRER